MHTVVVRGIRSNAAKFLSFTHVMEKSMSTRKMEELIVISILIVVASFPGSPLYVYAREVGVNAGLATTVYIAGLFFGMIIMLITILMSRRLNPNRMKETNGGNVVKSAFENCPPLSNRMIPAITIIVIAVVIIYPIRLYAPDAKALFITMIYSVGILFGGLLIWIPIRFPLYSSDH